jgi:beta-phosphoglucomutase-like phosphatase (HAD superfamily)
MIKLAVLDMAGTTVRDEHEVEKCFKQACELTGLNLTDDEILAVQGWSKRFVFEYFWKRELGADHDEFAARVIHSYDMFKTILEQH